MALPVYALDTIEDAKGLIVLAAKLSYDGRYILPGFSGNVDDLGPVGDHLHELWQRIQANVAKRRQAHAISEGGVQRIKAREQE